MGSLFPEMVLVADVGAPAKKVYLHLLPRVIHWCQEWLDPGVRSVTFP